MSVLARMNEFIKQLENGDDEFFERLNQEFLEFCNKQERIESTPESSHIFLSTAVNCEMNSLDKNGAIYPEKKAIVSNIYRELKLIDIKNAMVLQQAA